LEVAVKLAREESFPLLAPFSCQKWYLATSDLSAFFYNLGEVLVHEGVACEWQEVRLGKREETLSAHQNLLN
jgi:hypothetical protein